MNKEYWYFTFVGKQNILRNKYVKISGTYSEARKKMCENFGDLWGFQYSEEDFLPQIEQYGLTEIGGEEC